METPKRNQPSADDITKGQTKSAASGDNAVEPDGTPVLDEKDLEENNLTVEEAANIEWDDQSELDEEAEELEDEDEEEELKV